MLKADAARTANHVYMRARAKPLHFLMETVWRMREKGVITWRVYWWWMTGYADQRERASGIDQIVSGVLLKPFDLHVLQATVEGALHPA